jgi:hypothetical protein
MNKLAIASIALVALAALTFFQLNARRSEDTEQPKVTVELPKIKSDQVEELELSAPDKPKVRLVKKDGAWRVAEPVDAKADDNAVNTAVTKLTELELAGVAATLPKSHEKLEVDEKSGTHVIAKGGGKTLLDAYIGAYKSGSSMVRLNGQDAVAAVRGSIRFAFTKDVKEWRDRQINEVPAETVQQITFVNKDGRLQFKRENDAFVQVLAKGEKKIDPLDANKVKGVVGTAANLSATDFAAGTETPEQLGFTETSGTVVLDVKNDKGEESQITYRIGAQNDQSYYLRKDGDDVTYLISAWVGGRLLSNREGLIKKEKTEEGSRENPIQVQPNNIQNMDQLPPEVQKQLMQQLQGQGQQPQRMPPGHP